MSDWLVQIGAPIHVVVPKNVFRLNVEFMIGDADGEIHETLTFKTVSELSLTLDILDKYSKLSWNAQCDIESSNDWQKLMGEDHICLWEERDRLSPAQQALSNWIDIVPSDPQTDGERLCGPRYWSVTAFDGNGVEHSVEITSNGKPFATSRH